MLPPTIEWLDNIIVDTDQEQFEVSMLQARERERDVQAELMRKVLELANSTSHGRTEYVLVAKLRDLAKREGIKL
jgi:hypothetical protein